MSGVSFNRALSLLCAGHSVARKNWNEPRHFTLSDGVFYEESAEERTEANFTAPDVLANDWFIVKG